ncbi:MAG: (2Fe-2S)-binding protein [Gammaproteobacteria bacterium]|nr:(2Fe-2S)-binding protein [Gammaproteobacteria bacterium]
MIVCVCKQVSESQVREALRKGHSSVDEISRCLGVGTGCGTCLEYAQELIENDSEQRCNPICAGLPAPA